MAARIHRIQLPLIHQQGNATERGHRINNRQQTMLLR
ncbi:Uncharacterised protein [Vibrio cholerae]|nr:Uncharacterised protein [Vibrio cholerae]CSE09497.1 Uncharacterised protein [Vibrio cholerae]CSI85459.1 Uncharacterised protein [Vibrio cholerae]